MEPQEIQALAMYNAWANNRLMRRAAHLSRTQLQSPGWLSHSTIFGTLVHLFDVQWSWKQVCKTGRLPTQYITESDFRNIHQFREKWREDDLALISYTRELTEQQLRQMITYSWPQARPRAKPLWHILLHIINHGTHHRAEIGQHLSEIHSSLGDMDLLKFLSTGNT